MHSVVYSESVWVNFQQESMTLCSLHVFFYHSQPTQNLFNNLAQLKITSPFAGVNGFMVCKLLLNLPNLFAIWQEVYLLVHVQTQAGFASFIWGL